MKRKRFMVIIGVILIITVTAAPVTASAASSEVVIINGTGRITLSVTDPEVDMPPTDSSDTPSGVGTVSKTSSPKTGVWLEPGIYVLVLLSGLMVLLLRQLIKWHLEDVKFYDLQKS